MRGKLLFERLLDVLFPPHCVVATCAERGAWLCPVCLARIRRVPPPVCEACGVPMAAGRMCDDCRREPPPFDRVTAAGVYTTPLRDAIHALKYRGVKGVAPVLGALAAAPLEGELLGGACVVPVPPHPRRARGRGVDHTRHLADAVSGVLGVPAAPGSLARTRDTAPQVGLAGVERRANVEGAFRALVPPAPNVILVDDVVTTGSTARACAAALRAAGARRVWVCAVARAVDARPVGPPAERRV